MMGFNISEITNFIYVSSFPKREHVEQIRALGVKLVISLYLMKPHHSLGEPPVRLLWMPVVDSPLMPIPIGVFKLGVQAALPVIEAGGKVLVHCRWGVHRSVAMACCILIAQGYSLNDAVVLVKRQRAVADPQSAHILSRIQKFEQAWQA